MEPIPDHFDHSLGLSPACTAGLEKINRLAKAARLSNLAAVLELDPADLRLSSTCVGTGLRKGIYDNDPARVTHFMHMCRVAFLMQHFYPSDISGRRLAILHDIKEEALPGQETLYLSSDLAPLIDLLTEVPPLPDEIARFSQILPTGYDPRYFAKYKPFIATLKNNWALVGPVELCDRLDGSLGLSYLLHAKYASRLPIKALESLGRTWATLEGENSPLAQVTKTICRSWIPKFHITEAAVSKTAAYFFR